jgi:hypothetical protein
MKSLRTTATDTFGFTTLGHPSRSITGFNMSTTGGGLSHSDFNVVTKINIKLSYILQL